MFHPISRRSFLKVSGAVAAAVAMAACSGGGSSNDNGNVYTEVTPGLLMRAPSDFTHSSNHFGLIFWFKNTGTAPVELSTSYFSGISCNGDSFGVFGLNAAGNQKCQLPAGKETPVTLYLNTDDVDSYLTIYGSTISNVKVNFEYQSKKATYSGIVPARSPMTVTNA